MYPVANQPELRWWDSAWRYALAITIAGVAWFEVAQWQWDHDRWWFWTDLALGIAGLAVQPWRRKYPVVVASAVNALTVISASAAGPATLALVSLATRRRWREIIPVSILALAAGLAFERVNPISEESFAFAVPIVILLIAVTVGWGLYIGSRRELLSTLRERAEIAEAGQTARLAQARAAERARIAREMHDVLAHRISLVTMHAGALVYREDLSADDMRATAQVIQDNSHQAMVELREVLGILREGPGDADPELPQPSAKDLPALLDEARQSGMKIDSSNVIALDEVPETLGRTLYRVVQEGLTNTRKHATDTLVAISVSGGPDDGLSISIRNPLRIGSSDGSPQSGLGLIGLAERTELAGGRLRHRITPTREFVLEAWLPWST